MVLAYLKYLPIKHPHRGQPTYFIEKIVKGLHILGRKPWDIEMSTEIYHIVEPKYHTIREGHRWVVGDKFSPRAWSDKPYHSKQISIAADIEIKKVWNFQCSPDGVFFINGKEFDVTSSELPMNDGLSTDNFLGWFPVGHYFDGQIICWNEQINY